MNREQIEAWCEEIKRQEPISSWCVEKLRDLALRSLESAEPVAEIIPDERAVTGTVRWLHKSTLPIGTKLYASAPAAAPEAVSVPKKEWEDALAQLSTLKDGIREIDGQFVLCWTQEQVDLAKKRGAELHDRLAAAKEGKP